METNQFILALSKTLPESCIQGIATYLVLQLLFSGYKRSTPLLKFNLYYTANLFLFIGFLFTFFHHYQQVSVSSFSSDLLPDKFRNDIQPVITKQNLYLQFNFWINHYAYLITGFYLLGLVFCMLKLTIGIINISWFRNNKYLKLDDYLTNNSIRLSSNFRLIKTVSVFISDKISVPLTIGFIKPVIIFPIALINQLSTEQTEAILLHELAHIKRNDYLLNLLLCVVQSFLFFNPAIWLMQREINKYREQCCDDLVLEQTQNNLAYAHALLLIEQYRNHNLNLTLASNGKKYTLLNRIKRITNMKMYEASPQNKLVVLLLAFITIGLTVAWNLPVKKLLKNHVISSVKITETKSNGITSVINAENLEIQKHNEQNQFKLYTNKINFQPNNKLRANIMFSGNRIAFVPEADTIIQSKNKFKLVLEDSLGNKKEYNSIDELPAEDQKQFLKQNSKLNKLQGFNSPDFKIDTNEFATIKKQFNSPEWKKQMAESQKQSRVISEQARKQFDSPEFKAQMEKLQEESKATGEQASKQFDSPEFKKQMEILRLQVKEMGKYYQSPEWKKQQKKMKKEIEKSQKEWKNSMDIYLKPELPVPPITPEKF